VQRIFWQWSSLVEFGITGYYNFGQLQLTGGQDTELFCHYYLLLHCVIAMLQTGGQTDERYSHNITTACYIANKTNFL